MSPGACTPAVGCDIRNTPLVGTSVGSTQHPDSLADPAPGCSDNLLARRSLFLSARLARLVILVWRKYGIKSNMMTDLKTSF